MFFQSLTPQKAIPKALLKVKPQRADIETLTNQLAILFDRINENETEEFHKNLIADFLKKTGYEPRYYINTHQRKDLVIHNRPQADTPVGVILEVKKPTNKTEIVALQKMNAKALQELVPYYMRERITRQNLEIKNL